MATVEERMRILKMVEEGKLTPEDAAKLLSALTDAAAQPKAKPGASGSGAAGSGAGAQAGFQSQAQTGARARHVRIRVLDAKRGRGTTNVDVNLPIGLIGVIARLTDRFMPPEQRGGVDVSAIWAAVESGATGKIVDVVGENGERVEIILE